MKIGVWLGVMVAIVLVLTAFSHSAAAPSAAGKTAPAIAVSPTHIEKAGPPVKATYTPHPTVVPVGKSSVPSAPQVSNHWYDGIVWNPSDGTVEASTIETQIQVPSAIPLSNESDDFYYVILSTWDNNASYDQIGFTQDGTGWYVAYSYTYWTGDACTGSINYVYSPDALELSPGAYYTFGMLDYSDGYVEYFVLQGSSYIFDEVFYTGGTQFVISYSYCGDYDTTDYEEVYTANQYITYSAQDWPTPSFPMHFVGGFENGLPLKDMNFIWGVGCGSGGGGSGCIVPTITSAGAGGRALVIGNEHFQLNFYATFPMRAYLYTSGSEITYSFEVGVTAIGSAEAVQSCYEQSPAFLAGITAWGTATPSFIATVTLTLGTDLSGGWYYVWLGGWTSATCSGYYSYVTQEIWITD